MLVPPCGTVNACGFLDSEYIIFQLQIVSSNIITMLSKMTNVLIACSRLHCLLYGSQTILIDKYGITSIYAYLI